MSNVEECIKALDEEHNQMCKHAVWRAVLRKDVPAAAKILTSTWVMKEKANGTYRARLHAQGFQQMDGQHYNSHNITLPVTSDIIIRIIIVLIILANWDGELLDVKGVFPAQ